MRKIEIKRERDRRTDKQTDRQTGGQTDKTDRQTERHIMTLIERERDKERMETTTYRDKVAGTGRHIDII